MKWELPADGREQNRQPLRKANWHSVERQKPYRAAIIGCGRVGGTFDDDPLRTTIWTHAGAYLAHPRTELVAAADRNPEVLAAFGSRWGVSNLYSDARDLLDDTTVDILSICTWSDSHQEIALLGAEAGVKAIWCEKPMAHNLTEADRMLGGCRGLVLAVNHVRRWDTCYSSARDLLQQGVIGRFLGAFCTYSGGISDMGTHLFDILMYLVGEAEAVWARPSAADLSPDPSLSGDIAFHGGVLAHIVGLDTQNYEIFEIDVLGTDGRLRITSNGYRAELWDVGSSVRFSGVRELEFRRVVHEGDEGQRMVEAVSDIAHCIEHGGQTRCSGKDGRASLELAAAFLKSHRSGRKVPLPLTGRDLQHLVPIR